MDHHGGTKESIQNIVSGMYSIKSYFLLLCSMTDQGFFRLLCSIKNIPCTYMLQPLFISCFRLLMMYPNGLMFVCVMVENIYEVLYEFPLPTCTMCEMSCCVVLLSIFRVIYSKWQSGPHVLDVILLLTICGCCYLHRPSEDQVLKLHVIPQFLTKNVTDTCRWTLHSYVV